MALAPEPYHDRQAGVARWLEQQGVDGFLVTDMANIRYLTGFSGSAGLLVINGSGATLVTDFRYSTQAPREVGAAAQVVVEQSDVWRRASLLVQGMATLGFEAGSMTVASAQRLGKLTAAQLVPATDVVEVLRAVKSAREVEAIRNAARLCCEAVARTVARLAPGQSESEVAGMLEAEVRKGGSEGHPFPTIVASGPQAALPHATTGSRRLAKGDLVLIDFGAKVDGYCADITRTVVLGRADEKQRTVYQLVLEAQRRALSGIRAGMTGREADALAREPIAARGFGSAFGHSLGHGLGLEVHEAPRLGPTADGALPAGAVVTVEPGVYLPGWGGVRLEDDIHITNDGSELLSDGAAELTELI